MISLDKVQSFIQGNYGYYKDKLFGNTPGYIKQQVLYRLHVCKDDCLVNNSCVYCGCPPKKKSWAKGSCNNNERFPALMNKDDWKQFKKDNNIIIKDE